MSSEGIKINPEKLSIHLNVKLWGIFVTVVLQAFYLGNKTGSMTATLDDIQRRIDRIEALTDNRHYRANASPSQLDPSGWSTLSKLESDNLRIRLLSPSTSEIPYTKD